MINTNRLYRDYRDLKLFNQWKLLSDFLELAIRILMSEGVKTDRNYPIQNTNCRQDGWKRWPNFSPSGKLIDFDNRSIWPWMTRDDENWLPLTLNDQKDDIYSSKAVSAGLFFLRYCLISDLQCMSYSFKIILTTCMRVFSLYHIMMIISYNTVMIIIIG